MVRGQERVGTSCADCPNYSGAFSIEKVPAGDYTIEAWHPHFGLKTAKAKVEDGKTVEVNFTYDGTEPEPVENKDEMKDLF